MKKALYDLRVGINLMPLSYNKLGLGEVRPTEMTFQMAYRSITSSYRIIEDVLAKIDKFIFPMDFVILFMNVHREVPIIL